MRGWFAALVIVPALALTACGDSMSPARTATPRLTASRTATPVFATATPAYTIATPPTGTVTPAAATATLPPNGDTGIEGMVTIGPTCPVERVGSPCPDRPYEATIAVLDSAGRQVAEARSGADGHFLVLLPPGTYTLRPRQSGTPPHAAEVTVTVAAGYMTDVQVAFDSGIR